MGPNQEMAWCGTCMAHVGCSPVIPHKDGKIRGMRSTAELFLYIDVPAAMQAEFSGAHIHLWFLFIFSSKDGMVFYRSKNEVILTQGYGAWKPARWTFL